MKEQQVSVGALIVRSDKRFLLLKRSASETFLAGYWEIPGGGSDYGETPEEAVKREVKEECSLEVKVLAPLAVGHYMMEDKQRIEINFLCELVDGNAEPHMSIEHDEYVWVSPTELSEYLLSDYMREKIGESVANAELYFEKFFKEHEIESKRELRNGK